MTAFQREAKVTTKVCTMTGKGKTWRRPNPRDVLQRIIAENPKAGKRKLLTLFVEEINGSDGEGALDSVAKYWFQANYDRLTGGGGQA